nr:alpha/beta hydrolase [Agromyces seonyuensis]
MAVLVLLVVVFLVWASTVFQGEREASLVAWEDPAISIKETGNSWVMSPTEDASGDGLVFIPGARVTPSAYFAKLSGLVAETGATVVITKPTLNLAFFDTRPLSAFTDGVEGVDDWYVGGHSLGGVKACMLAADPGTDPEPAGLVLFGSYCASDLSGGDLPVLSLSGSEDGLSTPTKIEGAAHLLPASAEFVEIEGASHASFGDYGPQPGDGTATATDDEVREAITAAWAEFTE